MTALCSVVKHARRGTARKKCRGNHEICRVSTLFLSALQLPEFNSIAFSFQIYERKYVMTLLREVTPFLVFVFVFSFNISFTHIHYFFSKTLQCVHRDLASRNVLIDKKLIAKVADFRMARDISKDGEYIKTTEVKYTSFKPDTFWFSMIYLVKKIEA